MRLRQSNIQYEVILCPDVRGKPPVSSGTSGEYIFEFDGRQQTEEQSH